LCKRAIEEKMSQSLKIPRTIMARCSRWVKAGDPVAEGSRVEKQFIPELALLGEDRRAPKSPPDILRRIS
jgi:hypothetical protein